MRKFLICAAAGGLFGGALACATVDKKRADHHHDQAKREAKDLNFGKAVKQQKEANEARRDEAHDRW